MDLRRESERKDKMENTPYIVRFLEALEKSHQREKEEDNLEVLIG